MTDFNIINVEPPSHTKRSSTQSKMFKIDCKDLSKLVSPLKDLQAHSSKILKQYHDFSSETKKKTAGLPYHMIKKFEQLNKSFAEVEETLEFQCRFFSNQISNRDFEKSNAQNFFKKTLLSYDEKRLWLKKYILKNEEKMQVVQQQVKKNVQYQTHKYTDFPNLMDIDRIEHNYEHKINSNSIAQILMHRNIELRRKVTHILRDKRKNKLEEMKQTEQNKNEEHISQIKEGNKGQKVQVLSFLYHLQTKMEAKKELVFNSIKELQKRKTMLTFDNMQIKLAIDMIRQELQKDSLKEFLLKNQQDFHKSSEDMKRGNKKITKTDYMISLKELNRNASDILKMYGQYFQYSLLNYKQFPNSRKSRSEQKRITSGIISKAAKQYEQRKSKKYFQDLRKEYTVNKVHISKDVEKQQEYKQSEMFTPVLQSDVKDKDNLTKDKQKICEKILENQQELNMIEKPMIRND